MRKPIRIKTVYLMICCILVGVLFAESARALPRASVKYATIRQENPEGVKNALIIPYAFSTESMGITLGIGAAAKGYGQDQLLVAGTAFASFDEAVAVIAGM
jgi:hypothetical protein